MEIVDLISVSLEHFIDFAFYDFCMEDRPFKVHRIAEVHFAVVDKIVGSNERLYSLLHCFDVQVVFGEKVFIRTLSAPIPGIEFLLNFFTGQDADVFRQNCIEH